MTLAWLVLVMLLSGLLVLTSYIERVYSESGKLLSREFDENIDVFEEKVEPRLGSDSRRISSAIGLASQLVNAAICFVLAYLVFRRGYTIAEVVQAVVASVLILLIFNRIIPFLLFSRTRGDWLVQFTPLIKLLLWAVTPITVVLSFCMQVAALAEKHEPEEPETPQEAVEALIEAGQEEGILEESDRELIHSVVEFGDKITREVMTARPDIFAVPVSTTIAELHDLLREHNKSRIPVYKDSIDDIVGIVFTPDLLQVADTEAESKAVESILRPAYFVPETKPTTELLRELQKQKSHMAIVIDEYGGVAGVVTVEDLVEEIVGELHDEREPEGDVVREAHDAFVVPGKLDISRLEDLFEFRPEDEEEVETSSVGGFVTERLGHIPQPGEILEESGLRFEVLQSTDRRIEKLRITRISPAQETDKVGA